jgi:lipopolysaccharide/colanic/teichoic acid biosynthesis glycosyltransferase
MKSESIIPAGLTGSLRSTAVRPEVAILDPVALRERMNHYRMRAGVDQSACVLIEVRLPWSVSHTEAFKALESVIRFSQSYWIHAQELGWISDCVFGILLPNATINDGLGFAERLSAVTHVDCHQIRVLTTTYEDRSDEPNAEIAIRTGLLADLFVKRTPIWKRAMDIVGSLAALAFAVPVLLLAAILIRISSRGPIFFRQQRVGIGGHPFMMYKLRTMTVDAEDQRDKLHEFNESDGLAFKMAEDPRVTGVGKWLRSTSIDELPQLFNVLRGDMSLVGPRPLPVADWKPQHGWHTLRHDVAPGLTCIWQVSGRNQITFDRWMMMDLDYIRHRCLKTDLTLLAKTIPAVLTRRGVV